MNHLIFGYLFYGFGATWLIWRTWKTFGWEGLAIKFALFWDFLLVVAVAMFRKIPFTHLAIAKPHDGPALWLYLATAMLAFSGYWYMLIANRPTRWLLERPAWKWVAYSVAAFVCLKARF